MILLVPDKFKGTYSATEIAGMIENAIREAGNTSEEVVQVPLADGGEGSMEVVLQSVPGAREEWVDSKDALMRDIYVPLVVAGDTVFIEMARCVGLMMLDKSERNPMNTTTYGLGMMMMAALEFNPRRIIVGIGGSATNDGGRGMVEAVGLENLHLFDNIEVQVACDVKNPLLGPNGATAVFAPQKGATEEMLPVLEKRMEEWCVTAGEWLRSAGYGSRAEDFATIPGGGAAGGVGAGLYAFFGATLQSGWRLFADLVSLDEKIKRSRMVITGEGRLDASSLSGKLVSGLATLCSQYHRRLYVVCGQNKLGSDPSICDVVTLLGGFKEKISEWCRTSYRDGYLPSAEGDLFGGVGTYGVIAGCDEAGRGPLAGPVYAAAVVLPEGFYHPLLKDSKQMTAAQRDLMRSIIEKEAVAWCVASCSAAEIDEMNILQASITAMQRALDGLKVSPGMVLVDGNRFRRYVDPSGSEIPYKCIVKGDDKVPEISAASILAKTYRDEYMTKIAADYPMYGWERNMGYPTEEHREAIKQHGLCEHHRRGFSVKIHESDTSH